MCTFFLLWLCWHDIQIFGWIGGHHKEGDTWSPVFLHCFCCCQWSKRAKWQHLTSAADLGPVLTQGSLLCLWAAQHHIMGNTDVLQSGGFGDHHGMRSYYEATTFMSSQWHIWRPQGHTVGMSQNQTCHWCLSHHWHNISYWLMKKEKKAEEQRQGGNDQGGVRMLIRIQSIDISRAEKHGRFTIKAAPVWELSQMQ